MDSLISLSKFVMKSFVLKNTWTPVKFAQGWGNGYVVIPVAHPLHGVHYDMIDIDVHGGLTFSELVDDVLIENFAGKLSEEDKGCWVVGFDTAHAYSNEEHTRAFVEAETNYLRCQLVNWGPAKITTL
jgi:hypothetical protein